MIDENVDLHYICEFIRNAGELIVECLLFAMYFYKDGLSLRAALNEALLEWDCKLIKEIKKEIEEIVVMDYLLHARKIKLC